MAQAGAADIATWSFSVALVKSARVVVAMEMGDLQPFATTLVLRTSRKLNFRQVLSVRLEPIEGLRLWLSIRGWIEFAPLLSAPTATILCRFDSKLKGISCIFSAVKRSLKGLNDLKWL